MRQWSCIAYCTISYVVYSACGVPSVKLMFVGYSGHGKTTLLNHMVNAGKPQGQGITKL